MINQNKPKQKNKTEKKAHSIMYFYSVYGERLCCFGIGDTVLIRKGGEIDKGAMISLTLRVFLGIEEEENGVHTSKLLTPTPTKIPDILSHLSNVERNRGGETKGKKTQW
jgi:hypothetical protein